jgi:thiosulfate dehydrogenase (quinone) large subunit
MKHLTYSNGQILFLVALRMAIGWYILYQGMVKYFDPGWSAEGYLLSSQWIFSGIFTAMAESAFWLGIVNFLNIYGQIAIGLGLILGLFTRVATISAIIMISLFYIAHPPLARFDTPGVEVVVNHLFIIVMALCVLLVFPTSKIVGLDRLVLNRITTKKTENETENEKAELAAV